MYMVIPGSRVPVALREIPSAFPALEVYRGAMLGWAERAAPGEWLRLGDEAIIVKVAAEEGHRFTPPNAPEATMVPDSLKTKDELWEEKRELLALKVLLRQEIETIKAQLDNARDEARARRIWHDPQWWTKAKYALGIKKAQFIEVESRMGQIHRALRERNRLENASPDKQREKILFSLANEVRANRVPTPEVWSRMKALIIKLSRVCPHWKVEETPDQQPTCHGEKP
jgi:hypothetical protein